MTDNEPRAAAAEAGWAEVERKARAKKPRAKAPATTRSAILDAFDALAAKTPIVETPAPRSLLASPRLCSPERVAVWRAWMDRCWGTGFAHGDYLDELFTQLSRRSRIGIPDVAEGADLLNDAVEAGWIERLHFQPTVSQQFLGMAGVNGGADLRRAVAILEKSRRPGDRDAFALGYGYAPNRACEAARGFVVEGMR